MVRIIACTLCSLILLSSCNGNANQQQQPKNETAAVQTFAALLDSTQLIDDLAFLSSPALEGRLVGTEGNKKARNYIAARFDSLKLQKPDTSWFQPFPARQGKTGVNVIGMIKGTTYPDQYYVVSAHYDHLGKKGTDIYAGADDNASGSAALLAMAAYFTQHPPQHSIIFAAFDAEEGGLVGSKYFADHPAVDIKKILLNINMDMVSRNDKNEIYASGTFHYPFLQKYIDSIQTKTSVTVSTGHDDASKGASDDWTSQSDHYAFHLKNIPYIYFGVEDHPDYHHPSDTFEKVNKGFYYKVCNMIAETVLLTDRQVKLQ
ncbi:M28 family peptidase [Pseudoflavitalea sp. G-6-1-2]|uniref:M28 family peptidase n=1 Tax=Pseudoflavitalea sp. G-6-1-2 TaxID=2728841 RepID=UPI00146C4555|nr:M28 family peptidase [Pseudoflavitalea sp. G-6-1-2]NML19726.1 M28 family peptidase [Pseudoflavitalea sp. G-6-1-2]